VRERARGAFPPGGGLSDKVNLVRVCVGLALIIIVVLDNLFLGSRFLVVLIQPLGGNATGRSDKSVIGSGWNRESTRDTSRRLFALT
jgi:hypothetical protein